MTLLSAFFDPQKVLRLQEEQAEARAVIASKQEEIDALRAQAEVSLGWARGRLRLIVLIIRVSLST